MNGDLCREAVEVGAIIRDRLGAAGGVDILRRCVNDPAERAAVGETFGDLGIWDVVPADGALEFEVAAEVARAAGHFAVPYPVVERLGASGAQATTLVSRAGSRVGMHVDLDLAWNAVDLAGRRYSLAGTASSPLLATQLAPFGVELDASPTGEEALADAAVLVTLQSWWLLGLLQNAVADTAQYTREREQFGRTLSQFQAVAFQLSDMSLETESAGELAKYALWSISHSDDGHSSLVEALGLRVAMQRAASVVLRGAHQLHGAMGFTDEVDVSWLSRASQAPRRLPEDSHRTIALFAETVRCDGYAELGRIAPARQMTV